MNDNRISNILKVVDYWKEMFKTWKILVNDYVIIASEDKEIMRVVSANLNNLNNTGDIYIIGSDKEVDYVVRDNANVNYTFIYVTVEMINGLNMFPSAHYIFDNIYRCTFDGEDINGYKLVGINGVTNSDIVRYGVLRLGKDRLLVESERTFLFERFEQLSDELKRILPVAKKEYEEMYSDNSKEVIFLTPLPGTGDIYLLCMYLKEYLKKKDITDYILYVTSENLKNIASLMGVKTAVINKKRMSSIYLWRRASGMLNDNIKILDQNMYQKQNNYLQAVPGNDFNTMIKCLIFENITIDRKKHYMCRMKFDSQKYGIKERNSILLAPYANTINEVDLSFWEEVANEFLSRGYMVFVNAIPDKKNVINGTIPILIPYEELDDFCNCCTAVIGVRSGLFDIISDAKCCLVILYKGKLYNSQNDTMNFFGLRNMGLRDLDLLEIKYDDEDLSKEQIKKCVIDYCCRECRDG